MAGCSTVFGFGGLGFSDLQCYKRLFRIRATIQNSLKHNITLFLDIIYAGQPLGFHAVCKCGSGISSVWHHSIFQNEDLHTKRGCVLRSSGVHLNEDMETLVKEYVHSEPREAEVLIPETTMGIHVIRVEGASPEDKPADVGVVLEGTEVLQNIQSVTHGCVMLFGLIYALNLSYPKDLKCLYEVFQKVLMELDTAKLSPKVQALKIKMLREWSFTSVVDL